MNNIRTVIPLSAFKSSLNYWLGRMNEAPGPLLVTRHGRGLFVVQRVDTYAGMAELAIEGQYQLSFQQAMREQEEEPQRPVKS